MLTGTKRRRQSLKWVCRGQATEKGRIYQVEPADPRVLAEEQLNAMAPETPLSRSFADTELFIHEMELHQIELEIQSSEMSLARVEVETALEQYRDLYDLAPVGYLTLDRDGVIRAVNLTGAGLLGGDSSRLLGRRFGQFLAGEARPVFTEFLDKVFTGAPRQGCEVPLLKGRKPPFFVQIEAVATASDELCRAVVIDISARRLREMAQEILHSERACRFAKLEKANFELEKANIELEAFNYSVSHDLCNPLTSITGFAQVLLRTSKDLLDEQSRGHLRRIHASALRMKQLIDTLFDFSRVAHVGMHRQTFDMSEMAHAVAEQLELEQRESRVTFRIAQGIKGDGDAKLCRIVLENLMGNAWKYTVHRVGTVIEFGMTELGGKPVFFVGDNGPGFNMAHAGQLFLPFQRIPGIDVDGHGIGLATVKRIVRRHGGRVWAESSPGDGATFFFTFE